MKVFVNMFSIGLLILVIFLYRNLFEFILKIGKISWLFEELPAQFKFYMVVPIRSKKN